MKQFYSDIEVVLQTVNALVSQHSAVQWQLIAVLVNIKSSKVFCQVVYFDASGTRNELMLETLNQQIIEQILKLKELMKHKVPDWNQAELRIHRDSTIEVEYSLTFM